ncbi:uncharacterized protein [Argopecten irradians]|uniref:uncharacterized protein n=1 Tax=Argopecten irradians TaxID=31199 RepID=UPI00371794EA
MSSSQSPEDVVYFCRLMQLIQQYGTIALKSILIKLLWKEYVSSKRPTFTYFTDGSIVMAGTNYLLPNPLPDLNKCVQGSKDGDPVQNILEVSFLTQIVNKNDKKLRELNRKKIINQAQWKILFSNRSVNIHDLDVSLLSVLIFNVFKCKPSCSMDSMPLNWEVTEADDVLRVRLHRNKLAHLTSLVISRRDFNTKWKDISLAIARLTGSAYQDDIDRLKETSFEQDAVDENKKLRQEWSENVTNIYQSLSDMQKELKSIKRKPRHRHRKGVAIQLKKSDDLQRALRLLDKKGIATKVISLDETDSESSGSKEDVATLSKSTGCLGWSDDFNGESTIRHSKSTDFLGPGTLRLKKKAEPFHEMFSGQQERRWTTSEMEDESSYRSSGTSEERSPQYPLFASSPHSSGTSEQPSPHGRFFSSSLGSGTSEQPLPHDHSFASSRGSGASEQPSPHNRSFASSRSSGASGFPSPREYHLEQASSSESVFESQERVVEPLQPLINPIDSKHNPSMAEKWQINDVPATEHSRRKSLWKSFKSLLK